MPVRIQRHRTKGWRAPEGARYVGHGTPFCNPFRAIREDWSELWIVRVDPADGGIGHTVGDYFYEHQARRVAVEQFQAMLRTPGGAEQAECFARELRGHDLMCWCPADQPCHADVLIEISNKEAPNA